MQNNWENYFEKYLKYIFFHYLAPNSEILK